MDLVALPDHPDTWGDDLGGFRQRWIPGAFGDLETLAGVHRFKVEEDSWVWHEDALAERTILKAVAVDD